MPPVARDIPAVHYKPKHILTTGINGPRKGTTMGINGPRKGTTGINGPREGTTTGITGPRKGTTGIKTGCSVGRSFCSWSGKGRRLGVQPGLPGFRRLGVKSNSGEWGCRGSGLQKGGEGGTPVAVERANPGWPAPPPLRLLPLVGSWSYLVHKQNSKTKVKLNGGNDRIVRHSADQ